MKLSKPQIILGIIGIILFVISLSGVGPRLLMPGRSSGVAAPRRDQVNGATEAIRLTRAEGVKSIGRLIREQDPRGWEALPDDKTISSLHFFVDPFHADLIMPRVEQFMPPGFEFAIMAGQDKRFFIPRNPLTPKQGLDLFLVGASRVSDACNFLLIIEFYPQ